MKGTAVLHDPDIGQPSVIVGIDGSQAAIEAAEWAIDEAVTRKVPLRLIYVIPELSEPAPFAAVGDVRMEREYGETALRIAAVAIPLAANPSKSKLRCCGASRRLSSSPIPATPP